MEKHEIEVLQICVYKLCHMILILPITFTFVLYEVFPTTRVFFSFYTVMRIKGYRSIS